MQERTQGNNQLRGKDYRASRPYGFFNHSQILLEMKEYSLCLHLGVDSVLGDVELYPHHQQLVVRAVLDVDHVDVRGVLSGSELH